LDYVKVTANYRAVVLHFRQPVNILSSSSLSASQHSLEETTGTSSYNVVEDYSAGLER